MSNQYKASNEVPTEVLAARLDQLADAVTKRDFRVSEFTMRVPAEVDRDADLVLCEAAHRLKQLESERDALVIRVAGLEKALEKVGRHNDHPGRYDAEIELIVSAALAARRKQEARA